MWRPDNWKNPYMDKPKQGSWEWQVFERGADVMLEALSDRAIVQVYENAQGLDTITFTLPKGLKWPAEGKLVFIPGVV